jgi:transposase
MEVGPEKHWKCSERNQLLREHGFDEFVEARCAGFYAQATGRPSLPPGIYFRLLLIGYFEGIDSERGIAWRAADSLALRDFLGLDLHEAAPDHSTISRTRRLIAVETHRTVFTWVAQCLGNAGLIKGKTFGLDATTLEANAALRSIVRRDTGEGYEEFLTRLANASGIGTPTRGDLARLDRKRKKKGSNDDWTHPHDPDAKITKMKDGRTHLAHKAEHAIDLETGAIVGVTVQGADEGDTTTIQETLPEAAEQLEAVEIHFLERLPVVNTPSSVRVRTPGSGTVTGPSS